MWRRFSSPGQATYGAAVTALGVLAGTASGWITASMEGTTVETGSTTSWLAVVGAVVVGGIWAIVAAAIGMLTRSPALAITVLLLWRFVAEALLPVLLRRPSLSGWMPSGVADSLTGMPGQEMTPLAGGGLLLGYALVVGLVAWLSFLRRDLSRAWARLSGNVIGDLRYNAQPVGYRWLIDRPPSQAGNDGPLSSLT